MPFYKSISAALLLIFVLASNVAAQAVSVEDFARWGALALRAEATIDGGKSRVKIPAGVQSGKQLRLRSKGMPALRGGSQGDLYIELTVETPVNLTARQRELLKEFEDIQADNNPESQDFFSRVKKFWGGMAS